MANEPSYLTLQEHYERKLREHGDNHRGVDWPNRPDAEKRYDVMLDMIGSTASQASLLDIGCGLAHLYDWIVEKRWDTHLTYEGLDISPAFITACRRKHRANQCFNDVFLHARLPSHYFLVSNCIQ